MTPFASNAMSPMELDDVVKAGLPSAFLTLVPRLRLAASSTFWLMSPASFSPDQGDLLVDVLVAWVRM